MRDNGYFGIGCMNMKTAMNYGTLFRTAQILNADFIFLIGSRFKIQPTDTMKSWRHMPLFEYSDFTDFNNHRPHGSLLIGIELIDGSTPLHEFKHPKQACYLLGAEDHGLTIAPRRTEPQRFGGRIDRLIRSPHQTKSIEYGQKSINQRSEGFKKPDGSENLC